VRSGSSRRISSSSSREKWKWQQQQQQQDMRRAVLYDSPSLSAAPPPVTGVPEGAIVFVGTGERNATNLMNDM
jgi:hypothetical protein